MRSGSYLTPHGAKEGRGGSMGKEKRGRRDESREVRGSRGGNRETHVGRLQVRRTRSTGNGRKRTKTSKKTNWTGETNCKRLRPHASGLAERRNLSSRGKTSRAAVDATDETARESTRAREDPLVVVSSRAWQGRPRRILACWAGCLWSVTGGLDWAFVRPLGANEG